MPQNLSEFFTPQSILTLTGATGAVYVVTSGLQHAFSWNPRWFGLALSLLIALVGTYATQPHLVASYLVAVVNGFLIYCTAVGVNSITSTPRDSAAVARGTLNAGRAEQAPKRTFRSSWF
jgi:hypothetical protein